MQALQNLQTMFCEIQTIWLQNQVKNEKEEQKQNESDCLGAR